MRQHSGQQRSRRSFLVSSVIGITSSAAHALSTRAGSRSGPVPDVSSRLRSRVYIVDTDSRGIRSIRACVVEKRSVYSLSSRSGKRDLDRNTRASSAARSSADRAQVSSSRLSGGMFSLAPARCKRELLSFHHPREEGGRSFSFVQVLALAAARRTAS